MSSKDALYAILKELSLKDLRVAKRYLEVSANVPFATPPQSLELWYSQHLVDMLPANEVPVAVLYLERLRSEGDPTFEMLLDQEEADEAKRNTMKQFFLEHYPDLATKLGTSEGRIAIESVKNVWKDAGSRAIAETIPEILGKLGTAYVRAASAELVRQNLTLEQLEQLWVQKYEPQLSLAIEVGAAWIDWSYQADSPDVIESASAQMESMSQVQKEAVQEYLRKVGRAMGQLFVQQGNSYAIQSARAAITEARRAFPASTMTSRNPLLAPCPSCRKLTPDDERFCQYCGEPFYVEGLRASPMVKSRFRGSPSVPIVLLLGSIFAAFSLGFVIGIVPGLLSGLVGWHKGVAIVLPIIWAIGYVSQRAKFYGDVDTITYSIAILGGSGFGASVWVFGNITS